MVAMSTKPTEAEVTALKAANPGVELYVVTHPTEPQQFVVRGPSAGEWAIYRKRINSTNVDEKVGAGLFLAQCCTLWPPVEDREKLFAARPALPNVVEAELNEIAGATQQAAHRKL